MTRDIEEIATTTQPPPTIPTTTSPPSPNPRVRPKSDPVLATCRCFSFFTVVAALLCISVNVISAVKSFANGYDIFDGIFRCYAVVIAVFVIVAETEWEFIIKFWKYGCAFDIVLVCRWNTTIAHSSLNHCVLGTGVLGWQRHAANLVSPLWHSYMCSYFLTPSTVPLTVKASHCLNQSGNFTHTSTESGLMAAYFSSDYNAHMIYVAVMTRAYPDIYMEQHALLLLRDIASYALLACGLIYVVSGVLCLGFLKRARQNKEVTSHQAIKDLEELERRRAELEALLIVDTP
ncbi:hypothetical protein Tco_0534148 [Tanacetum coccineum]